MLRQIFKLSSSIFPRTIFKVNQPKLNLIRTTTFGYDKFYSTSSVDALPNAETHEETDKDIEKRKKILYLEVDVSRQEGRRVPDPALIKPDQWDHLLSLKSRSARLKYYIFLWHLEKRQENKESKKAERAEKRQERLALEKLQAEENNHIIYGINHTTFLLRIYDSTINYWQNNRLMRAMQFGQKIVMDCSYDEHMNTREAINTAKQLMLCFADNRNHDDPFDLHYCNANYNATTMKYLQQHIPTMNDLEFPMNVHEKCFTEIFPKEQLVYLTPHCRTDLTHYNPDDIYIIGAIVDKSNNEPVSLAKAKKLGLRMARLPLDHYLSWGAGSGKSLTLNQVVNIMLDVKRTGKWDYALRHVPKRKIMDEIERKKIDLNQFKKQSKKLDFNVEKFLGGNFKSNRYTSFKKPMPKQTEESSSSGSNPFKK